MNDTTTTTNITPKVGDIFHMSWGYDQTNNNFFQVTRLTPKGVYVREICTTGAGGEGFMCQNVVPLLNRFTNTSQWCGGYGDKNPETFRRIQYYQGKPCFTINSRYFASLWNGQPAYESWYA